MANKEELRKVLSQMTGGDLKQAVKYMNSGNLHNKVYINIIITLCQLTTKSKIKDNFSVKDIKDIIDSCCEGIQDPNESEINNYLSSLFHLLKFLRNKIPPIELINYIEPIFPEWVASRTPTEDIAELISHFNILLHNDLIVPISRLPHNDALYKALWLHLRLHKYLIHIQPKALFSKIQAYASLLHKNSTDEYFQKFFLDVNNLISDVNNLTERDCIKEAYQAFLCIIFIYFSKSSYNFNLYKNNIDDTFKILEKYSNNDSEHKLCTQIFNIFYNLIVRKVEEYSKKDITLCKKLRESLELLLKNHGLTSTISKTFDYISRILRFLLDYYEKTIKENWLKYMHPEIQIEYIKIFQIIARIISKTEFSDNCTKNCLIKTNYTHAFTITSISGTFLNLSLRYEATYIEDIQEICLFSLKECLKYIDKLKIGNCEKWASNWRMIGVIIYNISSRFYRLNNYKSAKIFYHFLIKYIIHFEGIDNENSFLENSLGTSLNLIAFCYVNMKQYRSALTYIGLGMQYCPALHDKFCQIWCNAKAKANNDNVGNIAELTLNQILQNDIDVIKTVYPGYEYHPEIMEDLLYLELQSYSKIWSSKIPMNNASKELFKLSSDPITKTLAINLSFEKVIILQDEEYIENIEKTILALNKKDKRNSLSHQLCLSVLYYVDFQFKSYEILKKNLSEMNDNVQEETPILKPYEEPINPNDKCDIIPTYYNNKVENNMHLHKKLNKSIELWTKILDNENLESVKKLMEELNIDNLIKLTAYEYRLQNYTIQMLKIWSLYLQYGKIFERNDIIVTAVGFILEMTNCKNDTSKEMQLLAEKHLKELLKNKDFETIVTYYVNKSAGYLSSNLIPDGYEELMKAEKYLKETKNQILEARILYLKSLYLQKPCSLKLTKHDENYIVLAQNAFTTIAEFYKTIGNKCHYTLSVLFDISLSIGNLYKWLRMPREIRCYTSESVLLAQQMVLPLRTAQFFSLLAFTDLLTLQFEDCKVKISGLDYILCYRNTTLTKNILDERLKVTDITEEFEKLTVRSDSSFETMLDVPVGHRTKNLRGSPILQSKPFKIPAFIYHLDCNCFYCLNIDYQSLILECTHLEALFYMRECNMHSASEFFKGGLNLYKWILRKYESLSKTFSEELIDQFKNQLNFIYCVFLLDYSFYYAKKGEYDKANKIIESIIEILGDDIVYNAYFYSEVTLLQLTLLTEEEDVKPIAKSEIPNELKVEEDTNLSKTPENKISIAKVSVSVTPTGEPSPQYKVKKHIAFDIFTSDDDKETQDPPPPKNKVFKFKTPGKTPAPSRSKIKIYTPASNKKAPMVMSISPNPPEILHIPKSPLAPKNTESKKGPIDPETKKILEKRTKLLTEKLKQEQKNTLPNSKKSLKQSVPARRLRKELSEENSTEKIIETKKEPNPTKNNLKHKENVPTRSVRKNLLTELSDNESDEVDLKTKTRLQRTQISKTDKTVKKEYKKINAGSSQETVRATRSTRSVKK